MKRRLMLAGAIVLILGGGAALVLFASTVWWDDQGTGAAQDQLAAEFAARQATAAGSTVPIEDDPVIRDALSHLDEGFGETDLPTTTAIPNLVAERPPDPGEAVGRIMIPAIRLDWILVEGVDLATLALGPGHMPGTPLPGQPGNSVVSGHRTTHGAPFFELDTLQPGNRIIVETLIGTHVYEVAQVLIVAPDDVWVVGPVEGAWLTLTTCNPPYRSIERLVVFARLIGGPNAAAVAATLTGEPVPPQPLED